MEDQEQTNTSQSNIPDTFLLPQAQKYFDKHPTQTVQGTDAWGNSYIRAARPEVSETNSKYHQTLQQIHQLWQSTLEGNDQQQQFLETIITPQEIDRLNQSIDTLAQYPELIQKGFNGLNPWRILQEDKPEQSLQTNKTSIRLLTGTPAYQRLIEISKKIHTKQGFDQADIRFLDALAIARSETFVRVEEYSSPLRISPLTKKYILANAVERLLARELVPDQAFSQHQSRFETFANTMKQHGIEMPDWFTGYIGNEFSFSMLTAKCKTLANPGFGIWFNQRMASDPSYFGSTIDHERVHDMHAAFELDSSSGKINLDKYKSGFRSHEAATEVMSLIIRNNGDVQAALKENSTEFRGAYSTAAHQLLTILTEINTFSKDPFLAAKLMTLGIKNIRQDHVLHYVQEWYNQNLAQLNNDTYEQRMSPFDDRKLIRKIAINDTAPDKIPFTNTEQAVQHTQISDLDTEHAQPREIQNYKYQIDQLQKHPQYLIFQSENSLIEQVADKLFKDPKIYKEFENYLKQYYTTFLNGLKETLDVVKQTN